MKSARNIAIKLRMGKVLEGGEEEKTMMVMMKV
jgi:hypothetical protein